MKICETGGSDGFVRRTTDTKLKSDYRQGVVSWIFWYTISRFSLNEVLIKKPIIIIDGGCSVLPLKQSFRIVIVLLYLPIVYLYS